MSKVSREHTPQALDGMDVFCLLCSTQAPSIPAEPAGYWQEDVARVDPG